MQIIQELDYLATNVYVSSAIDIYVRVRIRNGSKFFFL